MFPLSGKWRRGLGVLAALGAAVQALYLLALAGSTFEDSDIDWNWVGFLVGSAAVFVGVAWLAALAAGGRIHWSARILFLALIPIVVFLFFTSIAFWSEAFGWFDYLLATAFTFSESAMLIALPALALGRNPRPRPPRSAAGGELVGS